MTVKEALQISRAIRPSELDETVLIALLLELEQQLAMEVRGEQRLPRAVVSTDLEVPAPFDRVYWTYLVAMIDLAAGNVERYRVSDALYRESRDAYARWYQRRAGQGR